MVLVRQLVLTMGVLGLCVTHLRADVRLFDQRIEKQEITELRYTVPEGCVITGLGLRADADNITTMHCRYHRLSADGRLVEPQEVRLGAEPDHKCEGKVLLPDGWVAVGFGAAGEPEWDVTLVRVWGRKLNADGTLGEVKTFSDGFKPERGPEREIILSEPDRFLCAAGARFGHNDINGIFGASVRIITLDDKVRARLRPLDKQAWLIEGMDVAPTEALAGALQKMEVGRVDLRLGSVLGDAHIRYINAMSRMSGGNERETHVWLDMSAVKESLGKLASGCPDLDGVVVDLTSAANPTVSSVQQLSTSCREANLRLSLRLDASEARQLEIAQRMSPEIGLVLANTPAKQGDLSALEGRDVLIELALADGPAVRAGLPDVNTTELANRLAEAQLAGANGFIVLVNHDTFLLPDSVNRLALAVLKNLGTDPFQPAEPVIHRLCKAEYGKAGESAETALGHAAAANDLIFGTLGIRFLWGENGIRTMDDACDRLRAVSKTASPSEVESIKQLLAPTNDTVEQTNLQVETALWLIRQSEAAAKKAIEASPGSQTRDLDLAVAKTRILATFCGAISRAFVLTQMYGQDVAPQTRGAVNSTLEELPEMAQRLASLLGDSAISEGLDPFIASARQSLKEAEKNAPIAVAFARIEQLLSEDKHEEAAQKMYEILHHESFEPHLEKNKKRIASLASRLKTLWSCPDNLRSLRGADGRWTIENKGGKWAWSTSENSPCIYFDILIDTLETPADYVLSFEYFDEGDHRISVHYDSDYPGDARQRQFHPTEPVQLTGKGTWKTATREMTRCRFSNGQNEGADLRFLPAGGKHIYIRDVRLSPKR